MTDQDTCALAAREDRLDQLANRPLEADDVVASHALSGVAVAAADRAQKSLLVIDDSLEAWYERSDNAS